MSVHSSRKYIYTSYGQPNVCYDINVAVIDWLVPLRYFPTSIAHFCLYCGSVLQVPSPVFPLLVHALHLVYKPPSPIDRKLQVNKGIDSTILLRDVINGNSVESHIPLFSPLMESIQVSDCYFPVCLVRATAVHSGRVKHGA